MEGINGNVQRVYSSTPVASVSNVSNTNTNNYNTNNNVAAPADKNNNNNSSNTNGKASEPALKKAVEDLGKRNPNMEAVFGYHDGTNRVVIKILDKETKEVKKEYPAEETLDMIQKVWELAGILVDEKR